MAYRLHIDIPIDGNEDDAIEKANALIEWWANSEAARADLRNFGIQKVNYRLGHDDDRQRSNYLIKNENGHINNKKSKILLDTQEV